MASSLAARCFGFDRGRWPIETIQVELSRRTLPNTYFRKLLKRGFYMGVPNKEDLTFKTVTPGGELLQVTGESKTYPDNDNIKIELQINPIDPDSREPTDGRELRLTINAHKSRFGFLGACQRFQDAVTRELTQMPFEDGNMEYEYDPDNGLFNPRDVV
jgi:hypothetical protein